MARTPDTPNNKPPRSRPALNPTASWYSSEAWSLFSTISEQCGFAVAKFLFEQCIKMGAEQHQAKEKQAKDKRIRAEQAPLRLPTITQINAADRQRICMWWARLLKADQKFSPCETKIISRLTARYVEVGGYPVGFSVKLPPTKKKGAVNRVSPADDLPNIFKARPEGLSKTAFAETLVPRYGATAELVLRKLRHRLATR